MKTKQHTIKEPVKVSGVGLHTGVEANMTFTPASPNHGIKFQRTDLPNQPIVDADVDYVTDLSRGTTIEHNGTSINTVEHTLAALVGLEIDNVLIQLDGPEIPIMDGSSKMFIDALQTVGTDEQNALRNFYEVSESIMYRDTSRDVEIAALPLDDYRVTVMVDYKSPVLGNQHASLNNIADFKKEIASCRTFCFLHELEMLYKNNLIRGGDLSNAIVVVDRPLKDDERDYLAELLNKPKIEVKKEGILDNVDLRYPNEPARHKLLDVVGDLALAGRPIKAQILAARPGHAANIAFAKKLKKAMKASTSVAPHYNPDLAAVMELEHILYTLPHRYPFRFVDRIIHLDDTTIVGICIVMQDEPFFEGHFPDNPVMPGVLQVEALAQTGSILLLKTVPDPENYTPYFLSIDKCKFREMVMPRDRLKLKCKLTAPIKRGIAQMNGYAYVGDTLVCEAAITVRIVRKLLVCD